eukprot:GHVR01185568.1.p1 GENE.GHVR01185568.1~~GHVR01185568.1.p1  ORF type:complete len:428 (-),score=59.68 GHVR01185568.1:469-1752(-)
MLKLSLVIIYILIGIHGKQCEHYRLIEDTRIGPFLYMAENIADIKDIVYIQVYEHMGDLNKMSNFMKPDCKQIDEIAEVIYDDECNFKLPGSDQLYQYIRSSFFFKPRCLITKYYIYDNNDDNVSNLEEYINIYNINHAKDTNKDKSSLDKIFDNIFIQILTGLTYLHDTSPLVGDELPKGFTRSVMHMDIKPENIYVTSNPNTKQLECKIGNFYSSVFGTSSSSSELKGTPMYYDPRRAGLYLKDMGTRHDISKLPPGEKNKPYTNKADVYSLGIIMFKFCYSNEPWYNDRNIIGNEANDMSYLYSLIMIKKCIINNDNYVQNNEFNENVPCIRFVNDLKARIMSYSKKPYEYYNIVYAEVITRFNANRLDYDNLNYLVKNNCDENRFNLIKKMLTYDDRERPTAKEALEIFSTIDYPSNQLITRS